MNEIIGYILLAVMVLGGVILYIRARRRDPEFRLGMAILMALAGMIEEDNEDV